MTIELKHGKWYQLNNGEVHKNSAVGQLHTLGGNTYYGNGRAIRELSDVSNEVHPDTVQNLNVKAGDVVKCVVPCIGLYTSEKNYIVNANGEIQDDAGDYWDAGSVERFIVVSHDAKLVAPKSRYGAKAEPRTWGELTTSEQDTIAGHYARGGDVEYWNKHDEKWHYTRLTWLDSVQYRIKPEPVVLEFSVKIEHNEHVGYATFQTIYGKPDWSTLKGADV